MSLTDPSLALQGAIVAALKDDAGVSAIVAARVFDQVGRNPDGSPTVAFPYIAIGDTQVLPELAECTDAASSYVTLHLWSRAVGFPEVKRLGAAVIKVLHDAALELAGGTLQSLLLNSTHYIRDPDGLTSHAVLVFEALTDAN
ncbi:DUF3168 domain-containing protein [Bradyrhizobium sp. USDA 4452]